MPRGVVAGQLARALIDQNDHGPTGGRIVDELEVRGRHVARTPRQVSHRLRLPALRRVLCVEDVRQAGEVDADAGDLRLSTGQKGGGGADPVVLARVARIEKLVRWNTVVDFQPVGVSFAQCRSVDPRDCQASYAAPPGPITRLDVGEGASSCAMILTLQAARAGSAPIINTNTATIPTPTNRRIQPSFPMPKDPLCRSGCRWFCRSPRCEPCRPT